MGRRGLLGLPWALACILWCVHVEGQSREVRLLSDDLKVEPVWSNIPGAVQIEFLKTGQVLVVQKQGIIRLYDSIASKQDSYTTVLDIQDKVDSSTDRGLLSVIPHQDFPDTGYFFLMFVGEPDPPNHDTCKSWACMGINQLARYKVSADLKTWKYDVQMLSTCQTSDSHSGGALAYDLKGDLLWAVGDLARYDSGSADLGDEDRDICRDPRGPKAQGAMRAQTDDVPGGKILKIYKDSLLKNFRGQMQRGTDYVPVAKGVRNTLRMAAHPETHDFYCGDTQWSKADTVYVLKDPSNVNDIATNFGWPCVEGNVPSDDFLSALRVTGAPNNCAATIATYKRAALVMHHKQQVDMSQSEHCGKSPSNSCTGVGWYTGDKLPEAYRGHFFWADYGRACVFWTPDMKPDGSPDFSQARALSYGWAQKPKRRGPGINGVVDIKTGPDGYLYFVDFSGQQIYRLQATSDKHTSETATAVSDKADDVKLAVEVSGTSVKGNKFTCCNQLSFALKATDGAGNDIRSNIKQVDWTMVTAHCPVDYCTGEQACHTHSLEGAIISSDKLSGTISPVEHELPSYVRIQAVAHYKDKLIRATTDLNPNTHTVTMVGQSPDGPVANLLLYADDFACTEQPCDGHVMADSSIPFTAPQIQAYNGEVYRFSQWEWVPQDGGKKQTVKTQIYQDRFTSSGQLIAWYDKQANVPVATKGPLSQTPEAPTLHPNYGYTGVSWTVPNGVPSNTNIYTIVDCKAEGDVKVNGKKKKHHVEATRSMIAQISSGATLVELTTDAVDAKCVVYFYDYDTQTRSPQSPTSAPAELWKEADGNTMKSCDMYVKIMDYNTYDVWRTQNRVPHAMIVNITEPTLTVNEYNARIQDAVRGQDLVVPEGGFAPLKRKGKGGVAGQGVRRRGLWSSRV